MTKKMKKMCMGWLLAGMLLLAACAPAAAQEPTPDVAAIQTQAVLKAMAQLTEEALLNPSATPVPATMTPLPTATQFTVTPTTAMSSGGSGGSGGGSGTPIPTRTPDAWRCQIIDEKPLDTPKMTGWEYDRIWVIKNIGTTTWWANDVYVQLDPDETWDNSFNIASPTKFYINKNVAAGETINIKVSIKVPTSPVAFPGYTMAYQMISENAGLVCSFWTNIPSTYPAPTKTPTKKP